MSNNGTFVIKQGDLTPGIRYDVSPPDLDLANATATFTARSRIDNSILIEGTAQILQTLPPVLGYAWQDGDTDTPGEYNAEFTVSFPGPLPGTIPNKGFIRLSIQEKV